MTTRSLQLAALLTASLSLAPCALWATEEGYAPREKWVGHIEMNGQRVPVTFSFENGQSDTILGDVTMAEGKLGAANLEDVTIVGSSMKFSVKGWEGSPTFRGEIAEDGLAVRGTYWVGGAAHAFEMRYQENEVTFVGAHSQATPSHGERGETFEVWTGGIDAPGGAVGVELAFANNADGTISGELSIPSERVSRVRVTDFAINGFELSFSVPNVKGNPTFMGRIAEDGETVAGIFRQGERACEFQLTYQARARGEAQAGSVANSQSAQSATLGQAERWEGYVELPGIRLNLLCDFTAKEDGSIAGEALLAEQGDAIVRLGDVAIKGNELTFVVEGVAGRPVFKGMISSDGEAVVGTYTHGGAEFACELRYVKVPTALAELAKELRGDLAVEVAGKAAVPAALAPTLQVGAAEALAEQPGVSGTLGQPERWDGVIDLGSQRLAFDLDFVSHSDGTITGDITIPAQGARDLPMENLTIANDEVRATIKGVAGDPTFKGRIVGNGERVEGSFTQGGGTFPFHWTYVKDGEAKAQEAVGEALQGYKQWLEEARVAWRAPGVAVAIIKDGRVILSEGLGTKDLDGGGPVTANTVFAIGSCSKAFTTFVLGILVDEGKLDWDKPVRTYIPSFKMQDPFAADRVTPRDMVTHRSGLPRHDLLWYNNSAMSREELVGRLANLEPSKDVRQGFQYNNLMYATAGYLAERVTGETWETFVKKRVLDPLGMQSTNFSVVQSAAGSDFAIPYEYRDEAMRRMPFRDISAVGPAGSINSSVADLSRWVKMNLGGGSIDGKQLISSTTLAELYRPQMVIPGESQDPEVIQIGYAMGWFVSAYRGHLVVEHGGNIDGFSALITMLPKDGLGVVVLMNMNASPLPQIATYHALDRLLGSASKDWNGAALGKRAIHEQMQKEAKAKKGSMRKQGTSPSHPLADYVGQYAHPGYGVASVTEAGGTLTFTFNSISAPLNHWHYDVFTGGKNAADPTFEDAQLLFRGNAAGDIDSLEAIVEPAVKPVIFQKRASAKMASAEYLARFVGSYELGPQVFAVQMRGSTLVLSVPGQPTYDLVPTKDDTFALKGVNGYTVRFVSEGVVIGAAEFNQPDGVYTAKRR